MKKRKKQKNNSTGFTGVIRSYDRSGNRCTYYSRIRAFIQRNRIKHWKNFYVHKWPSEDACITSAALWRLCKEIELNKE